MEDKYMATIEFTSLQALKGFIRIVKEAGGNVSISGEKPESGAMLDHPILVPIIDAESIFSSQIKVYASSAGALERATEVFSDKAEISAASLLLESVTRFTGGTAREGNERLNQASSLKVLS